MHAHERSASRIATAHRNGPRHHRGATRSMRYDVLRWGFLCVPVFFFSGSHAESEHILAGIVERMGLPRMPLQLLQCVWWPENNARRTRVVRDTRGCLMRNESMATARRRRRGHGMRFCVRLSLY